LLLLLLIIAAAAAVVIETGRQTAECQEGVQSHRGKLVQMTS